MADLKSRTLAKGQFTRAETILKKDLAAAAQDTPITTIERHLTDFSSKWQKVQDIHDEYVLSLEEPTDDILATHESWLDELATGYCHRGSRRNS